MLKGEKNLTENKTKLILFSTCYYFERRTFNI